MIIRKAGCSIGNQVCGIGGGGRAKYESDESTILFSVTLPRKSISRNHILRRE